MKQTESDAMQLVIGDKTFSSWSLRPWLALKRIGVEFTEIPVRLRQEDTPREIARHSPSGKLPVLKHEGLVVWDSLAICEYLADRFPEARLWPDDLAARAAARAAAAEMHAGFPSLRGELAMDLGMMRVAEVSEMTRAEIRRVVHLWADARERFGGEGPFLFGRWSIADAFFAPVATRFRSYGVHLSDYGDQGAAGSYAEVLLETPEFLEWERGAEAERAARDEP